MKTRNRQDYSDDREKSSGRSNDGNFPASPKSAEEGDVPCSTQYSGDKGPRDASTPLRHASATPRRWKQQKHERQQSHREIDLVRVRVHAGRGNLGDGSP